MTGCWLVPGCLTTAHWGRAKLCWAPGRAAPRPAHPAPVLLCEGRAICHTQSEWHIMWTHSGQHGSCFTPSPDQMQLKRLTFCCDGGYAHSGSLPTPALSFCKIILFTSQISKLLLSPFKYRARKIFSWKWKVLTDESIATYLVITRYIQVMVMTLAAS